MTSTMTTDPGSGPLRLRVSRSVVPPTFKGGTNLKDEIHHHDQLRPPPTRRFTGRGNGMQDVAAAAAAAALAPPLPPYDHRAGYTSFHTSVHLQQPQQQQQWQHHQRGKRYVAGTPGKSRLHHPPSTFDRSLDDLQRPPPRTPDVRTQPPVTRTAQRKGVIPRRMECTGKLAVATNEYERVQRQFRCHKAPIVKTPLHEVPVAGFSLHQHACNFGCSLFVREADEETKGERNGGRIREYEEQIKSGQAATMTRVHFHGHRDKVDLVLPFVRHGDKTKQAVEHHRKNLQQQGATTFLPTAPRAVGVRVFTFTARSLI
ncbi:hypothetical protein ALC56_12848 [Trachymyrmex septentrionalis]|uniref:Uncharacterized protein n=1 Tax=Trachymyrmex septentrionalis TaxID=34720 RepID=A0A195EX28_9HYME|nr:hypothetical protein ALC56_12848 [Trachymyrmex septentrionalis]